MTATPAAEQKYRVTFGHIQVGESARRYLNEALDRHWVSEGPNVQRFEREFARKFGYAQAVAASSGTDAGIVAMAASKSFILELNPTRSK